MRTNVIARKTHKWLGLFIGIQVVIWSLSGLYMTAIHIDIIHGDHLVRHTPPRSIDVSALLDPGTGEGGLAPLQRRAVDDRKRAKPGAPGSARGGSQ